MMFMFKITELIFRVLLRIYHNIKRATKDCAVQTPCLQPNRIVKYNVKYERTDTLSLWHQQ